MKFLGSAGVCLVLVLSVRAEDKKPASNAEKIVGTWVLVKSDSDAQPGSTAVFTKDGKLKITAKVEGMTVLFEGTYKVEDSKLTFTLKDPGGKTRTDTTTIKSLTDSELITNAGGDKASEFKRKK